MRNLLIFISKYNAFFFFIIFFALSLTLVIRNNSFQRASVLNSSNIIVGQSYKRINSLQDYLHLAQVNDSLANENARLRSQLKTAFYFDSIEQKAVTDTNKLQQYTYIVAQVVNNSIHQKNNTITIDRGLKHGIKSGMGVISSSGIVGIVSDVSEHFATIKSLLHQDIKISSRILENQAFGSLVWGQESFDPQVAVLKDIPNHVEAKKGFKIVTSGYSSLFPADIAIGQILNTRKKSGEVSSDIKVKLSTDFSRLAYVYVINNILSKEKEVIESPKPEPK
ncbi:MAG: rod shape-determining protein MreC [Pyrinomonadaceae bacterium]|nr:rod shape-determining protein MreC [Sphingobacteriaceae bacterium]